MRKLPSRNMPKRATANEIPGWQVALFFGFGLVVLIYLWPWTGYIILVLGIYILVQDSRHREKIRKLADERDGKSICTFARQFDKKSTDPWVIRSVYEEIQSYVSTDLILPISANDNLVHDLGIDEEDLDLDIVDAVAERSARSLEDTHLNPWAKRVHTAGELVRFFNAQPELPKASYRD